LKKREKERTSFSWMDVNEMKRNIKVGNERGQRKRIRKMKVRDERRKKDRERKGL